MYSLEALNARAFQCDSISDIQTLSVAASDMYPLRWSSVNVIYNNPTDTMTLTTTPEDTPSTAISSLSSTSSVIQVQPSVVVLDLPSSQAAPVAAIVGGVIGGLAVIVITIAGITYMCLHHRRTMGDQSDASGTNAAIKPLSSMGQLPPYGIMVDKTGIEGPNSRERAISELGQ